MTCNMYNVMYVQLKKCLSVTYPIVHVLNTVSQGKPVHQYCPYKSGTVEPPEMQSRLTFGTISLHPDLSRLSFLRG